LIEADRHQDNLISLLFFFQGLLDFIFDPSAHDRMLGHDQQQLVACRMVASISSRILPLIGKSWGANQHRTPLSCRSV
jgi:hypothetical protein